MAPVVVGADPLGRAMLAHQTEGPAGQLVYRDGDDVEPHDVPGTYFTKAADWSDAWKARLDSLEEPVLDVGCGTGKYTTWFQARDRLAVGIDASPRAVDTARARGVEHAVVMDMFDLGVGHRRFRSALVVGTQSGLAGSLPGIRAFYSDLATVTTSDARAIVDSYDPTRIDPDTFLGYRPDPRTGIARRTFHFEYYPPNGDPYVGESLAFILFSPERLRDVLVGTPWELAAVWPQETYYRAKLEK